MKEKWHAIVGWIMVQIGVRMARRALEQKKRAVSENKAKIGAAGAVALVLVGGVVVAKAMSGNGDD